VENFYKAALNSIIKIYTQDKVGGFHKALHIALVPSMRGMQKLALLWPHLTPAHVLPKRKRQTNTLSTTP
jgi:hypothetical protein